MLAFVAIGKIFRDHGVANNRVAWSSMRFCKAITQYFCYIEFLNQRKVRETYYLLRYLNPKSNMAG